MKSYTPIAFAIGLLLGAGGVYLGLSKSAPAETGMMMMEAPAGASEATKGYVAAMNTMSMDMAAPFSGDADVDFVRGMIPHHQGAVDAAKIVLKAGSDPEVKAFAEKVVAAQEAEILFLQDWLKRHGN